MDVAFEHEIRVRYRDLDTHGHVNNVVYGTYCEEARLAWARAVLGLEDVEEFSTVVASFEIDFHRPVRGRPTLTVEVSVADVGRSSFAFVYRIRDGDGIVAEAESTQVHVDPGTREAEPLPDRWRDGLESA